MKNIEILFSNLYILFGSLSNLEKQTQPIIIHRDYKKWQSQRQK